MNASTSLFFLPALLPSAETPPTPDPSLPGGPGETAPQAALRGQPIVLGTAAVPSLQRPPPALFSGSFPDRGAPGLHHHPVPLDPAPSGAADRAGPPPRVSVDVMIPAADPDLAARLEPAGRSPARSSPPSGQLAEEGSTPGWFRPGAAGVNDGEEPCGPSSRRRARQGRGRSWRARSTSAAPPASSSSPPSAISAWNTASRRPCRAEGKKAPIR